MKKTEKLLELGIDPNFVTEDGSDTHVEGLLNLDAIITLTIIYATRVAWTLNLIFFSCVYPRHSAGVGLWSEWPCAVHHATALCWGTHRLQRQRRTHGSALGRYRRQCESHQRESPVLCSLPNLKSVLPLQPQVLLSYGASPNYQDAKGLTPLYHTAIMGDDPATCRTLL